MTSGVVVVHTPTRWHWAEWVASVLREYLGRAAADWDRQTILDDQLRRTDEELRRSQAESLAMQHAATRRRVLIEMLGLVIVAVGTIVSSA